jgi:hypothetical protein
MTPGKLRVLLSFAPSLLVLLRLARARRWSRQAFVLVVTRRTMSILIRRRRTRSVQFSPPCAVQLPKPLPGASEP